MNTIQIRKTCRKCQHHTIKEVQQNPCYPEWLSESAIKIKTDWCLLGDNECSQIKTCDPVAKEYKRCSTKAEVRTTSVSTTEKRGIKKSGKVQNGKKQKPVFSGDILPVGIVDLKVVCPIIRIEKSMGLPNTSTLMVHSPYVLYAIMEFTKDDTNVPNVEKLKQSIPIQSAITALIQAIKSELMQRKEKSTKPETPSTGEDTGKRTRKKL